MKLRNDIESFLMTIPNTVTLVAATKYVDTEEMKKLLCHGIRDFGENRVDSFLTKYEELKEENITWHFIGHLQRNKEKEIINKINVLHSLDSLQLARQIQKDREGLPLPVFIEVSVNKEESKNGVYPENLADFINELKKYNKIHLVGLMMMAKKNSSEKELHDQFHKLILIRDVVQKKCDVSLPHLSMGMSDDYVIAMEEGATHIRLGRALFITEKENDKQIKNNDIGPLLEGVLK